MPRAILHVRNPWVSPIWEERLPHKDTTVVRAEALHLGKQPQHTELATR